MNATLLFRLVIFSQKLATLRLPETSLLAVTPPHLRAQLNALLPVLRKITHAAAVCAHDADCRCHHLISIPLVLQSAEFAFSPLFPILHPSSSLRLHPRHDSQQHNARGH